MDYRFTLANERTYLAYVRTALALIVAGVALLHAETFLGPSSQTRPVGVVLMAVGILVTGAGYFRWRSNERRIASGEPLAPTWIPAVLAVTLIALGLLSAVLAFIG